MPDARAYPLYHVLNNDDLVTRVGSLKHFGLCLRYKPDSKFREAAYGWSQHPDARRARRDAARMTLYIADTPSFLVSFSALLDVVCQENTDDEIFGVSEGLLAFGPLDKVFSFAGRKARATVRHLITYMRNAYQEITGAPMEENMLGYMEEICRPIVRTTPLKRLMGELYDWVYPPHSLYNSKENGAYWRIVNEHAAQMKPFIWEDAPGRPPYRRYARGYCVLHNPSSAQPSVWHATACRTRICTTGGPLRRRRARLQPRRRAARRERR